MTNCSPGCSPGYEANLCVCVCLSVLLSVCIYIYIYIYTQASLIYRNIQLSCLVLGKQCRSRELRLPTKTDIYNGHNLVLDTFGSDTEMSAYQCPAYAILSLSPSLSLSLSLAMHTHTHTHTHI